MSFYNPDVHTPKAVHFIEKHTGQLVISDWVRVEMTSALGIQLRRNDISRALANELLTNFSHHCSGRFYQQIAVTTIHFSEAERLLRPLNRNLRSADALHLAVAKLENLALVTADGALANIAREEGVATLYLSSQVRK
ncbi:MAG: type II toxin-antitoxin system VapC family toxin [Trueperaceae bacterium]|nr:MAG: type II toxin-antitoxin system VapC family toxin [Trueperaceae bacterium]